MNIYWNASEYARGCSFVPGYGESVMDLLTVPKGARVADIGCGNGTLTARLKERGYDVTGIDGSPEMLRRARADHPDLPFVLADACDLPDLGPFDALFSNAVFHWIDVEKQDTLLRSLARALKPGGELVFEFGGYGCAETVHSALERRFSAHGRSYPRVFYFPTIGQYAPKLEAAGLRPDFAVLFDRPTPMQGGRTVSDWIRMFVTKPFGGMDEALRDTIISETEDDLRGALLKDGVWYVDYVRIRMRARKIVP